MSFVIGDKFAYLHMPATAGTFSAQVLVESGIAHRRGEWSPHMRARIARDIIGDRFTIGGIRDPWSWYCSWIAKMRDRETGGPGRTISEQGHVTDGSTDQLARALAAPDLAGVDMDYSPFLPVPVQRGMNYVRWCAEAGVGLMTFMFLRSYTAESLRLRPHRLGVQACDSADWISMNTVVDAYVDSSRVRGGLAAALVGAGVTPPDSLGTHPAVNVANIHHEPTRHWSGDAWRELSSETIDLIGERDRLLVEGFGYEPGQASPFACKLTNRRS